MKNGHLIMSSPLIRSLYPDLLCSVGVIGNVFGVCLVAWTIIGKSLSNLELFLYNIRLSDVLYSITIC